MTFEEALKEYQEKDGKKVSVLCTEGDRVNGIFDELQDARDNDRDAIFLTHSRYDCVEIPLDNIVSIEEIKDGTE